MAIHEKINFLVMFKWVILIVKTSLRKNKCAFTAGNGTMKILSEMNDPASAADVVVVVELVCPHTEEEEAKDHTELQKRTRAD